jgi:hypothetical protein
MCTSKCRQLLKDLAPELRTMGVIRHVNGKVSSSVVPNLDIVVALWCKIPVQGDICLHLGLFVRMTVTPVPPRFIMVKFPGVFSDRPSIAYPSSGPRVALKLVKSLLEDSEC